MDRKGWNIGTWTSLYNSFKNSYDEFQEKNISEYNTINPKTLLVIRYIGAGFPVVSSMMVTDERDRLSW